MARTQTDQHTDKWVRGLEAPASGNKVHYDGAVPGFGVRVTAAGAKSFVLNYRTKAGRERRYTIGSLGDWTISAARQKAKELRRVIDEGGDPRAELQDQREAPTVAALATRAMKEHFSRKAPDYAADVQRMITKYILPSLQHLKVADVSFGDTSKLHHKVTEAAGQYRANRTLAALSKMMSLSVKWGMRSDNPCVHVEKNREEKRERFLTADELSRLMKVLVEFEDRPSANAVMLLLLTGARRGEVLGARWEQFDLVTGVWTKPASSTKQRKLHRVPLSAQVVELLRTMERGRAGHQLFPGRGGGKSDLQRRWDEIRRRAGLENFHLHDLRHTYASILASRGLSLSVIGGLLGHSDVKTTARYAHLLDDTLRAATATAGAVIASNGK
jgi:integrase